MERDNDPKHAHDEPDVRAIFVIGAVGVYLTVLIILAVQALFYAEDARRREAAALAGPPVELTTMQAAQRAQLERYRWIDRDEGIVGVPIERAMELIVAERGGEAPERPDDEAEEPDAQDG